MNMLSSLIQYNRRMQEAKHVENLMVETIRES